MELKNTSSRLLRVKITRKFKQKGIKTIGEHSLRERID